MLTAQPRGVAGRGKAETATEEESGFQEPTLPARREGREAEGAEWLLAPRRPVHGKSEEAELERPLAASRPPGLLLLSPQVTRGKSRSSLLPAVEGELWSKRVCGAVGKPAHPLPHTGDPADLGPFLSSVKAGTQLGTSRQGD